MAEIPQTSRGLFCLPNEILLEVLDLFPTNLLMRLTTTCRKLHTLTLRIVHNRLHLAAGLGVHALYLKCHHPSAELRAPKFSCGLMGTEGLKELLPAILDEEQYIGQIKSMFGLYSRYRPCREQPPVTVTYQPMTGSRIYTTFDPNATGFDPHAPVQETIMIDASESFTQLTTSVWLGRRESQRGILVGMHEVSAGWVRVWRDWLAKLCESRQWTDGTSVIVYESADGPDRNASFADPKKDPSILWIGGDNVGVKIRVRRKISQTNMDPFASDVEIPVSYLVEFEELLVRTSHLLIVQDEAQKRLDSGTGKAIVFGSFRG